MILPSASKIPLAMACVGPWHPRAFPWPKEPRSQAATNGDEVHNTAENHNADNAPEGYQQARTAHDVVRVAVDEFTAGAEQVIKEIPIAYNPSTGEARLLEKPKHKRDYSQVRKGELVGTPDLIVIRGGEVTIYDHKTGAAHRKGHASQSWQLRMLAVAARKLFRVDFASVALNHVGEGDFDARPVEFGPWDLDEFARALAYMVQRIEAMRADPIAPIEYVSGPHCYDMYCPIRSKCPKLTAALAKVEQEARTRLPIYKAPTNNEEAKEWRIGLRLAREELERLEGILDEYARRNPIDHGGGVMYGLVETTREDKWDLSVPGAVELIREVAGEDAIKVKISTSKETIETACRSRQSKRGEGNKTALAAFAKLREMGALGANTYSSVREFKRPLAELRAAKEPVPEFTGWADDNDDNETEGKKAS